VTLTDRWLLPDGIDEVLPPKAAEIERLRRRLLDLFAAWGYELVMPPLIEYLDSLLSGLGGDLELQTFKLTDQLTGRLMGLRADMTPQVSRIDAHRLNRDVPTRLCYLGPVLHALLDDFEGSRNPLQLGAELYGYAGIEGDVEILTLLLEALKVAGIRTPRINISHIGVFRGLMAATNLDAEQETALFELLQRKAKPEIQELLEALNLPAALNNALPALVELHGDLKVIDEARRVLGAGGEAVMGSLDQLEQLIHATVERVESVSFHIDIAEMRGYHYHTGVMFEVYIEDQGSAIAFGGRYDDVGRVFGRARPATGFSMDLKRLASLVSEPHGSSSRRIYAPCDPTPELREEIAKLRAAGERVVVELPGQLGDAAAMDCDHVLEKQGGRWVVVGR